MSNPSNFGEPLTRRQAETMRHVCKGLTRAEIVHEMGISTATISEHTMSVRIKYGARTLTQAAVMFDRLERETPSAPE